MPGTNITNILQQNSMMDSFPLTLSVRSILPDGVVHQETTTAQSVQEIVGIVRSAPGMGVRVVANGVILFPPGFNASGLRSRYHLPDALRGSVAP